MRKIRVLQWTETVIQGKKTMEFDSLKILNQIFQLVDPREMPKGLENFRLMQNIMNAYKKYEESEQKEYLFLEETEYNFFKSIIEKNIPVSWATSEKVNEVIMHFLEAEQVNL